MRLDIMLINRMISDCESGRALSESELDHLESAVLFGLVHGLSRQGLPILGMRAKTKLFERNFYLLESVRLLVLNGRRERLETVVEEILHSLKGKCYGQFCPTGECYEVSVCVLRFLRAVCPRETAWVVRMEEGIRTYRADRIRTKAVQRYVESALR